MSGKLTVIGLAFLGLLWIPTVGSTPQEPGESTQEELVPVSNQEEDQVKEESKAEMGDDVRRQRFLMELRKLYPQNLLPVDLKEK